MATNIGRQRGIWLCLALLAPAWIAPRAWGQTPQLPLHDFAADPQWEGFRNRLLPEKLPAVKQEFGYRSSHHARGKGAGEIGGLVQRATRPAWYAREIPPVTLNDRLSASGRMAVTRADASSGALVGWFNHASRGWRTPSSLGMRVDGNGAKYWLFYEYGTRNHQTGGGGAFEGDRYQTTSTKPFAADGTVHTWSLNYDPDGNDGLGILTFEVDGKTWEPVKFGTGDKEEGTVFDRFGIWNVQIPGESLELYLDDLVVNGEKFEFGNDPGWTGEGNLAEHEERLLRPYHDFGFSPTRLAGGRPGEIGGTIFRDEKPAYYAARTEEPLGMDVELFASGKVSLTEAASDSGAFLGWFDSDSKRSKNDAEYDSRQKNYLAILIEGPSRIGHYFRPAYSTRTGGGLLAGPENYGGKLPPVIAPDGRPHEWSMHYDPRGAAGLGSITVRFDGAEQVLALRPGDKQQGATFDRFGFFNLQAGGHFVRVFVDDLKFTTRPVKQSD